jgi:uroporphyrinogen III methyltransferase / synthase
MNTAVLNNRTILVTRSADTSSDFRRLLESHGANVICFPTIEIRDPDSWESCDTAIWKLAEYQGVCFTSKNSVSKFIDRIRLMRPQAVDTLATRNIYAVGDKTRNSLESSGFHVVASPLHASAKELAELLRSHQIHGARILFPKSQIAREELPGQLRKMGAEVDEITVYKTIMPDTADAQRIPVLFKNKSIDAVTFFSPSSAVNFVELFGVEILSSTVITAIGPTTAEAMDQLGLKDVLVAPRATAEGVIDTLEAYFEKMENK